MSPALKSALQDSAVAAGCSLNAYAVQVLAASAGHRARFRGTAESGPTEEEQRSDLRHLPRRPGGIPESLKERSRHNAAERDFVRAAREALPSPVAHRLVMRIEKEVPWHFVEWSEFNAPLVPADPAFDDLRCVG
jgi:hypothetical protein